MLEEPPIPELPTGEIVTELFHIWIGFYEKDQTWRARIGSLEDKQSMSLEHSNLRRLFAMIGAAVTKKELELRKVDIKDQPRIFIPTGLNGS